MENLKNNTETNEILCNLYNSYESKMYGVAFSILKNQAQAEDAVQDSFLKIIPHIGKISDIHSNKTKKLMIFTVKNISIDRYRRNQKESQLFQEQEDRTYTQSPEIKSMEDKQIIMMIISKLSPKYREIIKYHCYYGLNYKEISSILGISESVAAKRFERAKKKVKELMGDD